MFDSRRVVTRPPHACALGDVAQGDVAQGLWREGTCPARLMARGPTLLAGAGLRGEGGVWVGLGAKRVWVC
jgi:hypothetical protein